MARLDSQGCGVIIIIISIFTIVIIVIIIISVLFLLLVNFIIMLYNYYRVLQKKTAIHMKPRRYLAYPRNPQLQCCDRKCRASSTEMAVFFEGRQAQNSVDTIELGDRGGMKNPVCYTM